MKAICLLIVLVTAKALTLIGRDLPWSIWAPLVFIWQDVLVWLTFAAIDSLLFRRPWIGWIGYGFIVAYTALNVGVVQTLSTPITAPLLEAARGPMADSIGHHLDAPNLLRMGAVLMVAVLGPVCLWKHLKPRMPLWIYPIGLGILGLGLVSARQVDTRGLHRNAILAFWP